MASPVNLRSQQPDSLPADFAEWDGDQVPATLPEDFFDEEDSVALSASTLPLPAKEVAAAAPVREATLTPPVREAILTPRQPAAKQTAKQKSKKQSSYQRAFPSPSPAPVPLAALSVPTSATAEPKPTSKRPMAIILGSVAGVLLAGAIGWKIVKHDNKGTSPTSHQVTLTENTVTQPFLPVLPGQVEDPGKKPSAAVPVALSATDKNSIATTPSPVPVQSTPIMQQGGPSILPSHLKENKDAPPPTQMPVLMVGASLSTPDLARNLQSNVKTPVVTQMPSKLAAVSVRPIGGELIQSPAPIYPRLAKNAHSAGVVVLDTTISKVGVPTNVRVLSGPPLLRQAAMEAVKNWRYKPYTLSGQPVEMNTTISVKFALQ